jgi:hypothetical protein
MNQVESTSKFELLIATVSSRESAERQLREAHAALSEIGSLFLIADWDLSYDLKPLADRVFTNEKSLRNEIVWCERGAGDRADAHRTVLWYVKDSQRSPFVPLEMPRSAETVKRFGDGRIVSSKNARTGKRAPPRVEGASLATLLNDVWVWDCTRGGWQYDPEMIDGRAQLTTLSVNTHGKKIQSEEALMERIATLAGFESASSSGILYARW